MSDSIENSTSPPQLDLFAKLTCNSVTRRIQVPSFTSIELLDFEQQIRLLFQLEPGRAIRLTYLDEDGDLITIGSTIELRELFKSAAIQEAGSGAEYGTVKLNVQITGNSRRPMSGREGQSNDEQSSNIEENQDQHEKLKGKEKENEDTASFGNRKGDNKHGAEKLEEEITTFVENLRNVIDTNPELVQQGQKIIEELFSQPMPFPFSFDPTILSHLASQFGCPPQASGQPSFAGCSRSTDFTASQHPGFHRFQSRRNNPNFNPWNSWRGYSRFQRNDCSVNSELNEETIKNIVVQVRNMGFWDDNRILELAKKYGHVERVIEILVQEGGGY